MKMVAAKIDPAEREQRLRLLYQIFSRENKESDANTLAGEASLSEPQRKAEAKRIVTE